MYLSFCTPNFISACTTRQFATQFQGQILHTFLALICRLKELPLIAIAIGVSIKFNGCYFHQICLLHMAYPEAVRRIEINEIGPWILFVSVNHVMTKRYPPMCHRKSTPLLLLLLFNPRYTALFIRFIQKLNRIEISKPVATLFSVCPVWDMFGFVISQFCFQDLRTYSNLSAVHRRVPPKEKSAWPARFPGASPGTPRTSLLLCNLCPLI